MKKKKYLVKIEFHDSVKYLNSDSELSGCNTLFADLEESQRRIEVFCKRFNEQKIEEICNFHEWNRENIKVKTLKTIYDPEWISVMFSYESKNGSAPLYMFKYMIIEKS